MAHPLACPGIISNTARVWKEEAANGVPRTFCQGETFSFDGLESADFMYIVRGAVALNYLEVNGKSKCQLICRQNTLINEAHIITGQALNKIAYTPLSTLETLAFSAEKYSRAKLYERPDLLFSMAYSQSIKLVHANMLYDAISVRSKLQLICWYLLRLSEQHNNSNSFTPEVSQAQMSMLLGINPRTFNRYITFLKDEGIIGRFTKRSLEITHRERLRLLSEPAD